MTEESRAAPQGEHVTEADIIHWRNGGVGNLPDDVHLQVCDLALLALRSEPAPSRNDLVERLREHAAAFAEPGVMAKWDYMRSIIAHGSKASLPRDIFESLIDGVSNDCKKAADILSCSTANTHAELISEAMHHVSMMEAQAVQPAVRYLLKDAARLLHSLCDALKGESERERK